MDPRYENSYLRLVWDRQEQLLMWYRVERAWLQQIDKEAWHQSELLYPVQAFGVAEHAEYEQRFRHEFVAFLNMWTDKLPKDSTAARRWLHYGLTSSDVIDTATALQLHHTNGHLDGLIAGLRAVLFDAAERVQNLEQVGRTHGQWAEPRSAANPLYVLRTMLGRQRRRFANAADDLLWVDFSGPTGGRDGLDPDHVRAALDELGLQRALASTQVVPRDSLAHWGHAVAGLATICAAIADHYWMLAQSGIGEVRVAGGSPSSAMPHKNNPHLAENVVGLARLARGLASTLDDGMVQRGDRDLAHSSVERVAVPDLAHLAATTLERTTAIVQEWRYVPEAVNKSHYAGVLDGAASSREVRAAIRDGASREDAIKQWHEESYQDGKISTDTPSQ